MLYWRRRMECFERCGTRVKDRKEKEKGTRVIESGVFYVLQKKGVN